MKADAWMPLYIGDLLADTGGLDRPEFASYLYLIFDYWRQRGPLRDDDVELAAHARCKTPQEWEITKARLARFFQIGEGVWRHKRIDRELAKAHRLYNAKLKAAEAANRARRANAERDAVHTQTVTQSQSQSQLHTIVDLLEEPRKRGFQKPSLEEVRLHAAKIGLPADEAEAFYHHYEANGWMVGRVTMKSWPAAMINWRKNWQAKRYAPTPPHGRPGIDRNKGTLNENSGNNYDIGDKL